MPWLVDPDVEDGRQRWEDRDTIRWQLIAEVVQELGAKLANHEYPAVQEEDSTVYDLSAPERVALTPEERKIVAKWFSNVEAPRADPWADHLENGRHRLWNVWKAAPDSVLPILSDLLLWEDSIAEMGEEFARSILLSSKVGTLQMAGNAPVRGRSVAYFEHLDRNALRLPSTPENDSDVELLLMSKEFADDESTIDGQQEPPAGEGKDHEPQSGMKGWFSRLLGRTTAGK